MRLYDVLLFAHVLGAIVLVGGSLIGPLMGHQLKRATSVASLRALAGIISAVSKVTGPSAGTVLLAGIGMVVLQWSFADGWILVSLALFALAAVLGIGIVEPALKRVVEGAEAAPDGPVPAELRALVHDSKLNTAHNILLTMDIVVVGIMTVKPGLVTSVALAVVAVAAGAGLSLAERRREAPVATG